MKIQSMFQKDIDRDINGVIKVSQDDQQSLKQELSEYIITKELRRHFATFFDNYVKAIDTPTDKIGVWISGFFGSGKSHFLKMLSYLLSNKKVDGKHAFDYFADKFDDPMMYATVQKCVRIPTESILFNIDIEGPINKDKTAVLRVFAKVFYTTAASMAKTSRWRSWNASLISRARQTPSALPSRKSTGTSGSTPAIPPPSSRMMWLRFCSLFSA